MNTMHYKYAVEVERTHSITQAAENLFMAQPNLSKAIKELEENLGIEIFRRTSKGVVPTEKGAEFLIYAKNILAELEKMEALSKPDNPDRQSLNISIPRGSYIASGFINFVSELDPEKEIDINFQETNSIQTITNVVENSFSLGVIRFQTIYENYYLDYLKEKNLCHDLIFEFEYLALMSKKHKLAAAKTVGFDELCNSIEIVHGDLSVPYLSAKSTKMQAQASAASKKILVYERGSQFELLAQIPETYMWVSPVPESMLKRYDLIQRKCEFPDNRFKDLLIYKQGYSFTRLDKLFIDKMYTSRNDVALKEYK